MRVALAVVLLLAAGLGAYGRHVIVDDRGFADRAEAALTRPDVRNEVAARLFDRDPRLAVQVVGHPRFETAFREATVRMHEALFEDGSREVSLRLPTATAPALVTLGGGGALERTLRGSAPIAARIAAWWPAALALAVVLLVSAGRRQAGLAVMVAGLSVAAATVVVELALLRTFTSRHGDAVVDAIWDSYLADLRLYGLIAAAAGLLLLSLRWPLRRLPA
jgi:hypothetical protein